jgi:type II secretory pathway predicted ATPase ExeA
MSTYLKFFELEQSPFEAGEGATQVVLGTRALRDALATIETGLEDGIERICVSGGPGLGKTSLARALPKLLGDATRVAIVLDPTVGWESARRSIARQWELPGGGLPRAGLVEAARSERLVLVVDAAETATEEFLDHLDVLLSYRGEDASRSSRAANGHRRRRCSGGSIGSRRCSSSSPPCRARASGPTSTSI